jgi:hypothetical protein
VAVEEPADQVAAAVHGIVAWSAETTTSSGSNDPFDSSMELLPEAEAGVVSLVAGVVRRRLRALHDAVVSDEVDEHVGSLPVRVGLAP